MQKYTTVERAKNNKLKLQMKMKRTRKFHKRSEFNTPNIAVVFKKSEPCVKRKIGLNKPNINP